MPILLELMMIILVGWLVLNFIAAVGAKLTGAKIDETNSFWSIAIWITKDPGKVVKKESQDEVPAIPPNRRKRSGSCED